MKPGWGLASGFVSVRNDVAIGAADTKVIDRIKEAISQQDSKLGFICFAPRETADGVLCSKRSRTEHCHSVVPLDIVSVDAPAHFAKAAAKNSAVRLLKIARDLARKPGVTIVIVGISNDPGLQAKLIEAGCVTALPLDDALAAIPTSLDAWLIYRK